MSVCQLVPLLGELPELLSEAELTRSYLIRLGGAPMQQNNLFAIIHEN
jgi:hypothetical protein